jgi:hypothetical protein
VYVQHCCARLEPRLRFRRDRRVACLPRERVRREICSLVPVRCHVIQSLRKGVVLGKGGYGVMGLGREEEKGMGE